MKKFSKRKKWQGPIDNLSDEKKMYEKFLEYKKPNGLYNDLLGLVQKVNKQNIEVLLKSKQKILLKEENKPLEWQNLLKVLHLKRKKKEHN